MKDQRVVEFIVLNNGGEGQELTPAVKNKADEAESEAYQHPGRSAPIKTPDVRAVVGGESAAGNSKTRFIDKDTSEDNRPQQEGGDSFSDHRQQQQDID